MFYSLLHRENKMWWRRKNTTLNQREKSESLMFFMCYYKWCKCYITEHFPKHIAGLNSFYFISFIQMWKRDNVKFTVKNMSGLMEQDLHWHQDWREKGNIWECEDFWNSTWNNTCAFNQYNICINAVGHHVLRLFRKFFPKKQNLI